MNWQKLKSKWVWLVGQVAGAINSVAGYLSTPLNLFRFVILLMAVDFVAFMALTHSSYLQLLNPAAFLWAAPSESRKTIDLYFPRSLSLTGIEKIYPDEENSTAVRRPGAENSKGTEKPLLDAEIPGEVMLVKKRIAAPEVVGTVNQFSPTEALARRVILELIAGPSGATETLKARNLLKEPLFLRALWTYNDTLFIATEGAVWNRMPANERKITEYCINESLQKNLGQQKFVVLKE